jgi:hypothetical protein
MFPELAVGRRERDNPGHKVQAPWVQARLVRSCLASGCLTMLNSLIEHTLSGGLLSLSQMLTWPSTCSASSLLAPRYVGSVQAHHSYR